MFARAVAISLVAMIACGESKSGACYALLEAPIIGGSTPWPFAMMSDAKSIAAVIGLDGERVQSFCSGVVVADGILITAKHCVADRALDYDVVLGDILLRGSENRPACKDRGASADSADATYLPLQAVAEHDTEDIAVVHYAAAGFVESSSWFSSYDGSIGDYYIAGRGIDATETVGTLHVASVTIEKVMDRWIDVRVGDGGGACAGDSGSPLLAIRDGQLRVYGVLSVGSSSCRGIDRYLRVDYVRDWLQRMATSIRWSD